MPDVIMVGSGNSQAMPIALSANVMFSEGPPPGFAQRFFVAEFDRISYQGAPNVFATTGNPHWSTHPVWVSDDAVGFVIRQISPSIGGRSFPVYLMAVGQAEIRTEEQKLLAKMDIQHVSQKEFLSMRDHHVARSVSWEH